MNIFRVTTITFALTLLVACGGGGGGTAAAPTPTMMNPPTDNGGGGQPTGPQALPTALITDPAMARGFVNAQAQNARTQTTPPTATATEIQTAFQMEAMDADTFIDSDAFVKSMSFSNGADISAGGGITLGDFTFTSSLENIRMGIADRFNLERVSSQYSPVMDYRGVTFAQYQAAGRTDDNDVLEYQSYGGWLTNSAFSVDMLTIDYGSREDSILVGLSYGDNTGSRPTATASYNGAMIGINKNDGGVVQGGVTIDVSVTSNSANISFDGIVNINNGNTVGQMLWSVPINTDGTFSSTTGGDIDGAFFGANHVEVGGTFNRDRIIGSFGARKQ